MRLIRKNIAEFNPTDGRKLLYSVIDWDKAKYDELELKACEKMTEDEMEEVEIEDQVEGTDAFVKDTETLKMADVGELDYIIGADIVYWSQSVAPLISVVDEIFTKQENRITFYLAYIERVRDVHKMLLEELAKNGFKVERIDTDLTPKDVYEQFLYKITR